MLGDQYIYRLQRSWGKVIFSEACVKNSVHRGVVSGPTPGGGRFGVWLWGLRPTPEGEVGGSGQGVIKAHTHTRGLQTHTQGVYSSMHWGRPSKQMATAAGGKHPTGMHSCLSEVLVWVFQRIIFLISEILLNSDLRWLNNSNYSLVECIDCHIIQISGGTRMFRGDANSQSGCANLFSLVKTAWKWKNLYPGGGVPGAPLDPPMILQNLQTSSPSIYNILHRSKQFIGVLSVDNINQIVRIGESLNTISRSEEFHDIQLFNWVSLIRVRIIFFTSISINCI